MQPKLLAGIAAGCLLLGSGLAGAGELDCQSQGYRYQYCRADTGNQVQLLRQHSHSSCDYGRSWGYDWRGIWVDNGCSARFAYGRGGGGHHHRDRDRGSDAGAIIAGVAALAIIGAIANSGDNSHQGSSSRPAYDEAVPDWAVGRFRGTSPSSGQPLDVTIYRNGQVSGYEGRAEFEGQVDGNRIWLGSYRYDLARTRAGIRLSSRDDGAFDLYRN